MWFNWRMDNVLAAADAWLRSDPDPETRAELEQLLARPDSPDKAAQLNDRFGARLAFGTAGLRGLLGAGPGRMNQLLVQRVSRGLANYVEATVSDARARGIVIGYDARVKSELFAKETASVFAAAGFRVYLAAQPWPTPVTAWSVVQRRAAVGVMVTASHNPPAYNGYKVYWDNGAQIIHPHDAGISSAIDRVTSVALAPTSALITRLGPEQERAYIDAVVAARLACNPVSLRIAYTPLHGVGARTTTSLWQELQNAPLHVEPSQAVPDGTFPTVAFPNPEERGAMDRVIALGTRERADLVLAQDPDADRLAVALPQGDGFRALSGDQVGILLADYLLRHSSGRRLVVTTVVSSQLLKHLARAYDVEFAEVLTGFKWIADAALAWERRTGGRFVFGYEEALGYAVNSIVRDKDGVSAAMVFADLAAWNHAQGRSVWAHLEEIYRKVGVFVTRQVSWSPSTVAEIKAAMSTIRKGPPTMLGGHAVAAVRDFAKPSGDLPPSDILAFDVEGGHRVLMRPSGTEPKLKSYYEVREPLREGEPLAAAIARAEVRLATIEADHQRTFRPVS